MMDVRNAARRARGRKPRAILAVAAGCLAATAVAACSSSGSSSTVSSGSTGGASAASTATTNVKLGYPLPNVQSVAVQIAAKNGIFAKYGLNVTATSLGTANVVNAALTSGSVDYSLTSASQLITSVAEGAGVIAISAYTVGTPVDVIFSNSFMAKHHLSTSTPVSQLVKSLAGSHVGVSSPVIETQEGTLLKAYGVDPTSVNTLTVSSESGLATLLKSGQIDAFIAGPPVPQEAQAQGGGKILITSENAPVWNAGNANLVLAANASFAKANPALTKQVAQAVHAAVAYVLGNKAAAAQQSATLLSATPAEVEASLPLAGYSSCAPMSSTLWDKTIQFSIQSGSLKSGAKAAEGTVWTNDYVAAQSGC
jgi:ABC-type nitrate/sulfonate/bicarbonate transport system substrate-binding protein